MSARVGPRRQDHGVGQTTPRGGLLPASRRETHENIFLFIPNLIGYTRVVLAIVSLYYMPVHPLRCCVLYSLSCLLDALDGLAARIFNQSTKFGAVLDMVSDRCTSACLMMFLAIAFPQFSLIFQGLISLDFASHYIHMYATLVMAGSHQSHKDMSGNRPWVMKLYYTNTNVLFLVCFMNEMFFVALYLLSFSARDIGLPSVHPHNGNMVLGHAAEMEVARVNKIDDTIPTILLYASAAFMLFKQGVNVVQMIEASKWIAQGDQEQRRNTRLRRGQ